VARFDQRADVMQIGIVALSLVLGRLLTDDEYPDHLNDVLAAAWAISARGGFEPLPPGFRTWIGRALQVDSRTAFATGVEARDELDRVLSDDSEYMSAATEQPTITTEDDDEFEPFAPIASSKPQGVQDRLAQDTMSAFEPESAKAREAAIQNNRGYEPKPAERPYSEHDASDAFAPFRATEPMANRVATLRRSLTGRVGIAAAVALALLVAAGFAARRFFAPPALAATTGTVNLTTNPPGAAVVIDGRPSGVTPVTLTLAAGSHTLELRGAGEPRTMPLTVIAGNQMSQYVELPKPVVATGQLEVRTEPAGAQVVVDDVPRGVAPLTIGELTAGEHVVSVSSAAGSVKQLVTIAAGATASVVVPLAANEGAPVSGWISVSAPADVQLFENKKLLGTSESDRIMMSSGRHDIDIVNETLGYRATRTVQVTPGKVTPIKIEFPKGTIAINATPWAEVWIDGQRVGETPIGNLSIPIGAHEILFKHPDLGEQRQAISVTANTPARLSVDMRKK
jgi:hypothetical protein